jgi:hypothetical protein
MTKLLFGFEALSVQIRDDPFTAQLNCVQICFFETVRICGTWQNSQAQIAAFAGDASGGHDPEGAKRHVSQE